MSETAPAQKEEMRENPVLRAFSKLKSILEQSGAVTLKEVAVSAHQAYVVFHVTDTSAHEDVTKIVQEFQATPEGSLLNITLNLPAGIITIEQRSEEYVPSEEFNSSETIDSIQRTIAATFALNNIQPIINSLPGRKGCIFILDQVHISPSLTTFIKQLVARTDSVSITTEQDEFGTTIAVEEQNSVPEKTDHEKQFKLKQVKESIASALNLVDEETIYLEGEQLTIFSHLEENGPIDYEEVLARFDSVYKTATRILKESGLPHTIKHVLDRGEKTIFTQVSFNHNTNLSEFNQEDTTHQAMEILVATLEKNNQTVTFFKTQNPDGYIISTAAPISSELEDDLLMLEEESPEFSTVSVKIQSTQHGTWVLTKDIAKLHTPEQSPLNQIELTIRQVLSEAAEYLGSINQVCLIYHDHEMSSTHLSFDDEVDVTLLTATLKRIITIPPNLEIVADANLHHIIIRPKRH